MVSVALPPAPGCCRAQALEQRVLVCRHNQWQIQVVWADLPQVLACDPAWVSEPQAPGCSGAEANDLPNKAAR